jgi:hypothetical protein
MTDTPTASVVDSAIVADEPEMLSAVELILLSAEHRFGRMANALEKAATAATAGANNVAALTAHVNRLADAFESMAGFIGCITESVEGKDGVSRCYVRTRDDNHGYFLSEREGD